MKSHTKTNNNSLTGYLTAAVTVGTLASTSHAAVITLDVSSISGANAGIAGFGYKNVSLSSLSAGLTGGIDFYRFADGTGAYPASGTQIAVHTLAFNSPRNFSSGEVIGSSAIFTDVSDYTVFNYEGDFAPDFGPGSYIGFRSANGFYGYLEMTWTSATNTFEVIAGAYESTPGLGIGAGSLTSIPEPSTAVLSLGALAAGALIRRRKQAA
jgi:hypothetical protein